MVTFSVRSRLFNSYGGSLQCQCHRAMGEIGAWTGSITPGRIIYYFYVVTICFIALRDVDIYIVLCLCMSPPLFFLCGSIYSSRQVANCHRLALSNRQQVYLRHVVFVLQWLC